MFNNLSQLTGELKRLNYFGVLALTITAILIAGSAIYAFVEEDLLIAGIGIAILLFIVLISIKPINTICLLIILIGIPILKTIGTLTTYMILIAYLLMVFKIKVKQGYFYVSNLHLPILMFLGAHILSFWNLNSMFLEATILNILVVCSCACIFVLTINSIKNQDDLDNVINILFILLLLEIAIGFYQLLQFPEIMALEFMGLKPLGVGSTRPMGSFLDSFTYSFFLMINTVFLLPCILIKGHFRLKIVSSLLLVACLALILAVASKTSFLLIILGAVLFVLFMKKYYSLSRLFFIIIFIITIVYGGIIFFGSYAITEQNPIERISNLTFGEYYLPDTREGVYLFYMDKIKEHPWIGQGMFDFNVLLNYNVNWLTLNEYSIIYTHSTPLYILYSTGIVGFVCFISIFIYILLANHKALHRQKVDTFITSYSNYGSYLDSFQIVWILFLIWSFSMDYQRTVPFQHYIWTLLGLNIVVLRLSEREDNIPID